MDKIKVGVVGVGHLGRHHVRVYSELPEALLLGVYDIDLKKAKEIASEFNTSYFEDMNSLLNQTDAVSLVVPTSLHFSVGKKILEKGINLLIEKPITKTVKQAEKLVSLAREKNLVLQVGHIERFNPAFKVIEKDKLEPKFIESHRLGPFVPRGTDVAVILDLMIHDIDLILSLVKGRIKKIEACGIPVITDSEDIANARIGFENGCVANITASRISKMPMRKFRIFQKNTYISLDLLEKKAEIFKLVGIEKIIRKKLKKTPVVGEIPIDAGKTIIYEKPEIEDKDMLSSEIKSFLYSVRNKTEPKVSGEDGKKALEVALEIIKKAKLHRQRSR